MNSNDKIQALSLGMYGILFNNKWQLTVELFDGTKIKGKLKSHNTQSEPFKVTILLESEDNKEHHVDLKNVKDITT